MTAAAAAATEQRLSTSPNQHNTPHNSTTDLQPTGGRNQWQKPFQVQY